MDRVQPAPLGPRVRRAFRRQRCLFGSNWPVDKLFGTWEEIVGGVAENLSDFSPAERDALFAGTAERVYRI